MISGRVRMGWRLVFAVLVTLLGFNTIRLAVVKLRAQAISGSIAHTVVLQETVFDGKGVPRPGIRVTWAVRSDGSRLNKIENPATGVGAERIIEFASGSGVTTDDEHRTKSSIALDATSPGDWLRDPQSGCTNTLTGHPIVDGQISLGEDHLGGFRTAKIRAGKTTWWFALDYGCAMLQSIMDFGAQGRSEKKLIALIGGEPQHELFDIPGDYKEVPPSVQVSERCVRCSQASKLLESLDQRYHSHQAR